jgi:hypothetical protein
MKKSSFKTHQKKWERMSRLWNEFSKPGRPSKGDIENYDKLLKIALGEKILPKIIVLGGTPEIRDLLYKYSKAKKAEVICVDMTKDMYMAMNKFIKYKNTKEKFISANWLQIAKKIKPESIDIVIGDYAIENIGGNEKQFLRGIAKILKSDGSLITRAQIIDGARNNFKIYAEFQRICQLVRKMKISVKEASSYFFQNLVFYGWFLNDENKTSLSCINDADLCDLEKKIKNNQDKIENKVLKQLQKSWYLIKDKYWIVYNRSKLEGIIKKYFSIKKIIYSKDYEIAKQSPIYLLKK